MSARFGRVSETEEWPVGCPEDIYLDVCSHVLCDGAQFLRVVLSS